jgi:hypothetical protein
MSRRKTNKPKPQAEQRTLTVTPCEDEAQSKAIGLGAVRYVYQVKPVWPTYVTHVVLRLPFQGNTIEVDFAVNGHRNSAGKTWTMTGTAARPTLRPLLNWNGISVELVDGKLTVLKEA